MIEEVKITQNETLADTVKTLIRQHLSSISTSDVNNLHEMLLEQVEPPLLKAVMENCKFNQVRAAKLLGISRGTLRKKLIHYFADQYCGTREDY